MNQHAPEDHPEDPEDHPEDGEQAVRRSPFRETGSASGAENPTAPLQSGAATDGGAADESQRSARNRDPAETVDSPPLRVGSPFAVDPVAVSRAKKPVETFHDVGPIRYTAMGAVAASVMVLGFAATAAWWFPAGGTMIAALGCVLSVFGLYSTYRLPSSGLLAVHLYLFVFCYLRSLG